MKAILALVVWSCAVACGDAGGDEYFVDSGPRGPGPDAAVPGSDGGAPGLLTDSEPIAPTDRSAGAGAPPPTAEDAACYSASCAPVECAGLRSCCVGSGSCCESLDTITVPFGDCPAGVVSAGCLGAGVSSFGAPEIVADALVPTGDGRVDSGVVLDAEADLTTHRLEIAATFREEGLACDGCIESVAVGVTAQSLVMARVVPSAMLVYRAATSASAAPSIALVVNGEILEVLNDVGGSWVLTLEPSGNVFVARPGTSPTAVHRFVPTRTAHVVAFGHSVNRTDGMGPALAGLGVTTSLCDMPDAWGGLSPLGEPDGGGEASAPSLVRVAGSRAVIAFEVGGAIQLAESIAGAPFVARGRVEVNAFTDMPTSLADPEIVQSEGRFFLFVTARYAAGDAIARVELDDALMTPTGARVVLSPEPFADGAVVTAISQPSVHVLDVPTIRWLLAALVTTTEGTYLGLFDSYDGTSFAAHISSSLLQLTTRTGVAGGLGFDAAEISHPSLTVHNGAWQLFYTGREGPQSSIGLLLSDEFVLWRKFDRAVLSPGATEADAVGVRAADVHVAGDLVEMVVEADDGAATTLMRTTRTGTDVGAFTTR